MIFVIIYRVRDPDGVHEYVGRLDAQSWHQALERAAELNCIVCGILGALYDVERGIAHIMLGPSACPPELLNHPNLDKHVS